MGKNTNKPVRAPPPPSGGEADFEEKPFHSKEYENNYLDSLLNAKERPTWDEFKEIQRKKAEMDGDGANEEAQRRFRKELDEERAARLNRAKPEGGEKKDKKDKKEKKHKKEKKEKKHKKERKEKKKKRRRDSGSSDESDDESSEEDEREAKKKKKKKTADGPVSLRNFFAESDSDSD